MNLNGLFVKLFSKYVGEDFAGNKYYKSGDRRYVIYKGLKEPSKVPPMWHAWLHHLSDKIPEKEDLSTYEWQKIHSPNTTGTELAFKRKREIISSDYEAWRPSK